MNITTDVDRAVELLRAGKLVAFPTETVYGLGADATSPAAMQLLYSVKRRPVDHPVIAHIPSADAMHEWAVRVSPEAEKLAAAFWPGPLTLILHKRVPGGVDEATGGLETVGLRVPNHPLALELLRRIEFPLAAPSANEFGCVSPTSAQHVAADIGPKVQMILDGGPCAVGVESTIVDCTRQLPLIARVGGVPVESLAEVLGEMPEVAKDGAVSASGTLPSHYSPRARVELVGAQEVSGRVGELVANGELVAVIGMRDQSEFEGAVCFPSPTTDAQYAQVLYDQIRAADTQGVDVILAIPPSATGLGNAICDRLCRAATPRV